VREGVRGMQSECSSVIKMRVSERRRGEGTEGLGDKREEWHLSQVQELIITRLTKMIA